MNDREGSEEREREKEWKNEKIDGVNQRIIKKRIE